MRVDKLKKKQKTEPSWIQNGAPNEFRSGGKQCTKTMHANKTACKHKLQCKIKAQCTPKPNTPGADPARGGSQLPAAIFRPGPRCGGRAEVRVQTFCAPAGLGAGALQI